MINYLLLPSLPLLFLKTAFLFLLTFIIGFGLFREINIKDAISYTITLISIGISLLIISTLTFSIIGIPSYYGSIFIIIISFAKICLDLLLKKIKFFFKEQFRQVFKLIILSLIGVSIYFAPFLIKQTSGLYSRGGGDHNAYLSISDFFVSKSIWWKGNQSTEIVHPGVENWEVLHNLKSFQTFDFTNKKMSPLASLLSSTPYLSILPGSKEESYSAITAFHFALAGLNIALFFILLSGISVTLIHYIATPIFLSAIFHYIPMVHSDGFLLSTVLLNSLMGIQWRSISTNTWTLRKSYFGAHLIVSSALLLIYPQLFLIYLFFSFIIHVFNFDKTPFFQIVKYYLCVFLGNIILNNIFLLKSIPLLILSATKGIGYSDNYTIMKIVSFWSGIVDPGMYYGTPSEWVNKITSLSIVVLPVLVLYLFFSLKFFSKKNRILTFIFVLIFPLAAVYYIAKDSNSGFQAIRMCEFGVPYFIAVIAVGFVSMIKANKVFLKIIGILSFFLLISLMITSKYFIVMEILKPELSPQVEFRDANQLKMVSNLIELQKVRNKSEKDGSNLIYYLGSGYGVDHAGMTLLLRDSKYLAAYGINYDPFFQGEMKNKKIWDMSFLKNALLLVAPSDEDIIDDKRVGVPSSNKDFRNFNVLDTSRESFSKLIGSSWHIPTKLETTSGKKQYRYLRRDEGAFVVWSHSDEKVTIKAKIYADSVGSSVEIAQLNSSFIKIFTLDKWDGTIKDEKIILELSLYKGPNVIKFKPMSVNNPNTPPWLLFFDIEIL